MNRARCCVGMLLAIASVLLSTRGYAAAAQNSAPSTAPADEVADRIHQIEAMKLPEADPSRFSDAAYGKAYNEQVLQFQRSRSAAMKDLNTRFSQDPRVRPFLLRCWLTSARQGEAALVIADTEPILAATTDPTQRLDLLYVRAEALVWPPSDTAAATPAVEEFIRLAPDDPRGAELLFFLADCEKVPEKQAQLYRRASAEPYTNTPYGRMTKGMAAQSEGLGKSFELSFTDAIGGKPVSVQNDYHGKIVVVDFWATWCGPCCALLPENKQLYATYKDRGVEFVCVSLDEPESKGGLKALKEYVAANKLPWPQYYQGNGADSEFSSKWGVHAIPTVFVIDRDGKLACANASGRLTIVLRQMLESERIKAAPHSSGAN